MKNFPRTDRGIIDHDHAPRCSVCVFLLLLLFSLRKSKSLFCCRKLNPENRFSSCKQLGFRSEKAHRGALFLLPARPASRKESDRSMQTVHVSASKDYDILVGESLDRLGQRAAALIPPGKAALAADSNVAPLYADRAAAALEGAGYEVHRWVFPAGEASKTPENLIALLNFLAERRFSRTDSVFALGGGVTGDLAGFAASVFQRGVRLVQIPTSLLAMVDSSVGGKTAVDLPAGKNLAGTFCQPALVLCDVTLLSTLPADVYRDGWAEVIKYGAIADRALFEALARGDAALEDVITRCVSIKSDLVSRDEFDTGERRLLNYGHTVGHAIEHCSGYAVSHGLAVAMGMACAVRYAGKKGLCPPDCVSETLSLLRRYGLPAGCPYGADALYAAARLDKKRAAGKTALVLPEALGRCGVYPVTDAELYDFLRLGLEDAG